MYVSYVLPSHEGPVNLYLWGSCAGWPQTFHSTPASATWVLAHRYVVTMQCILPELFVSLSCFCSQSGWLFFSNYFVCVLGGGGSGQFGAVCALHHSGPEVHTWNRFRNRHLRTQTFHQLSICNFFLSFWAQGSHDVALVVLEFSMYTRLASNSQSSICLWPLVLGLKMCTTNVGPSVWFKKKKSIH